MKAESGSLATVVRVAYRGTNFCGFARQAPGLRTVQGELETILSELYGTPIVTRAASRTDAGVHARGQVVSFTTPDGGGLPPDRLVLALRGLLPSDLEVTASWSLPQDPADPLHPRRPNLGKHYCYRIRCARVSDPVTSLTQWTHHEELDVEAMRAAATYFVGEHDYAGFRSAGCRAQSTIRRITAVRIDELAGVSGIPGDPGPEHRGSGRCLEIHVEGDAFMMHMVRIMVGSLVEVGVGRRAPEWIASLLVEPYRPRSGPTAPALGLCLEEVKWPDHLRTGGTDQ
jgi:tRNA pseudouridine38-40 synthase